jgi:hypothetical protein
LFAVVVVVIVEVVEEEVVMVVDNIFIITLRTFLMERSIFSKLFMRETGRDLDFIIALLLPSAADVYECLYDKDVYTDISELYALIKHSYVRPDLHHKLYNTPFSSKCTYSFLGTNAISISTSATATTAA